MSCGIYMWISPSEKIYIGQSRNLENRKREFINSKTVYTSKNSAIDNARRVYNDFSKWKYVLLEECTPDKLNEREKFYIEKYNSFFNGYNSNIGGNFDIEAVIQSGKDKAKKLLQYGLDGNFIREWENVKEAAKEFGIRASSLSAAAAHTGKRNSCGFQWMWYDGSNIQMTISPSKTSGERISEAKYKPILQYKLDGTFIRNWKSIKDASITLKISHTHISACCQKKRPVAGGFQWKYLNDKKTCIKNIGSRRHRLKEARRKSVLQYSLNGDFIKEWSSITNAEKTLKISGISCCLHGKTLTAGDFQWKEKTGDKYPLKIDMVLPKHTRTGIGKRENNRKKKSSYKGG